MKFFPQDLRAVASSGCNLPTIRMKTFFHPPALLPDHALIPQAARKAGRLASFLIHAATPLARRGGAMAIRHPKAAAFSAMAGLGMLVPFLFGTDEMPGLSKPDRKEMPAAVGDAAREVFDTRFAEYRGSHYTIVVHCAGNVMPHLSNMPLFGGNGESRTKAPMLVCMELVEIQNLHTKVEPAELTKADELNDIRWKGRVMVGGEVERRRQLDLAPWVRAILDGNESLPLPWVAEPIHFEKGSFTAGLTQDRERGDRQPDALDFQEAMGGMMNALFGTDATGEFAKLLKGGPWGDWVECGKASYQNSEVQLRGKTTRITTIESMETAMDGKPEVTLLALHANNLFQMKSVADGNEFVFLVKPDIRALKKAGLLK